MENDVNDVEIIKKYEDNFLSVSKEISENQNDLTFQVFSNGIVISRGPSGKFSELLCINGFFDKKSGAQKIRSVLENTQRHLNVSMRIEDIVNEITKTGFAKTFSS